jgi:cyclophilin family peptidyl-prolyl cis-trans isomerase
MKKINAAAGLLIAGTLLVGGCGPQVVVNSNQPINSNLNQTQPAPVAQKTQTTMPEMIIDQTKSYSVILQTTTGDIEIALNTKDTPITANNFVWLAKKDFYNGTIFHRVMNGFMIQGGDPNGDGTGGPGYKFADEKFSGEYSRGTVAMANSGANTNGSQFFIMHADYPLPPAYVIFGHVTKGMDVVDKIATAPVKMSVSGENSSPVSPVTVNTVEIVEK